MRSFLAVLAGYAVFALSAFLLFRLTGQAPHADASTTFKTFATLFGTACAIFGGYVAGKVAKRSPLGHACAVGVLIAAIAAWSIHATPVRSAIWTQLAALLFMAPATILGGVLSSRGAQSS